MEKHIVDASLESINQDLIEVMAEFLDSEGLILNEAIGGLKDPINRNESELHIRMANAAFLEYKNTIIKKGEKKAYIGICKKSKQGNSNFNHIFIECNDGLFRSFDSDIVLTIQQIEFDVNNKCLKRIL